MAGRGRQARTTGAKLSKNENVKSGPKHDDNSRTPAFRVGWLSLCFQPRFVNEMLPRACRPACGQKAHGSRVRPRSTYSYAPLSTKELARTPSSSEAPSSLPPQKGLPKRLRENDNRVTPRAPPRDRATAQYLGERSVSHWAAPARPPLVQHDHTELLEGAAPPTFRASDARGWKAWPSLGDTVACRDRANDKSVIQGVGGGWGRGHENCSGHVWLYFPRTTCGVLEGGINSE